MIKVNYNQEKNGIEISFSEKPNKSMLEHLKLNGFRWSRYQNLWYAKETTSRKEFINTLDHTLQVKNNTSGYPVINIDDIENYIVDENLSKRENEISMFRTKNRNHTEEIQSLFKNWNDRLIEVLNNNKNEYIEYKSKRKLQSLKTKYFNIYIKMISHKANNPSWMVTGRGNLNVRRYEKKQNYYDKLLGESVGISDEFDSLIRNTKWNITKEINDLERKKIEELKNSINIQNIKFNRSKGKEINGIQLEYEVTMYKYKSYYILSNYWGKYRVYNNYNKEVSSWNTLKDAKASLISFLDVA